MASKPAPGEPGEIASRGDNVMMEYYNEPEQTAAVFRLGGGWLLTGDVGVRDEQGFITLIDRAKDMLISGGENVYPKEIEDVIYGLDAVAECAVFGVPDEKWGEVPAAYLQLKPGAALEVDSGGGALPAEARGVQASPAGQDRRRLSQDAHRQDPEEPAARAVLAGQAEEDLTDRWRQPPLELTP